MHVATYRVTKKYGGPEEGGWWYETGEPEKVEGFDTKFVADEDAAYALAREWNDRLDATVNKGRRPISSVLSNGVYRAIATDDTPEPFPAERPHYE